MTRKSIAVIFSLLATLVLIDSGLAGGIKSRMKSRLPAINQLKAQGVVGENNLGYLEFVGGQKIKADVVSAENADRKKVYAAIAKQQGANIQVVGQRRAAKISQIAKKGHWIQTPAGKWQKKS